MKKIYILDTSVLVQNPSCLNEISNSTLILPITVLEELDKLKSYREEVGKNARMLIKQIDKLSSEGDFQSGINLPSNSILKVDVSDEGFIGKDETYGDNKILACALKYKKGKTVPTLLSADLNLRIRAKALGIKAEDYIEKGAKTSEFYSGIAKIHHEDAFQELMEKSSFNPKNYNIKLLPNEFALFVDENGYELGLARKVSDDKVKLVKKQSVWGIHPRSNEQACLVDLLMDSSLPLVTVMGQAGSGKTLVALAAALELVLEKQKYDKLIIYRPVEVIGKELGYMPGNKYEKMEPYFQAIFDSFEALLASNTGGKDKNKTTLTWRDNLEYFIKKDKIELDVLAYARGRSLANALIIIDEAQNLPSSAAKTLLTRLGAGSKIVCTGDIEQIDVNNLDAINNTISTIVEAFKGSKLAGHISLVKGERSELANEAIKLLT
jgi:PhoH-like ATPase